MDTNTLIQAYAKDPINNYVMESFSISKEQQNSVCGDMIIVYVRISDRWAIDKFSYAWAPQMFTLAAASLLAEEVEWKKIEDVLAWNYATMQWLWFEVSPRRRRSAVSALLALKNAIHEWKGDWIEEVYADLM